MKGKDIRPYLIGMVAGGVAGLVILHPFSMLFDNMVQPRLEFDFEEMLKALDPRHVPMALFFALLGTVLGALSAFYFTTITRHRQRVRLLEGLLPICAYCKKIRDDTGKNKGEGDWMEVERYLSGKTHVDFTHGICPQCFEKIKEEF